MLCCGRYERELHNLTEVSSQVMIYTHFLPPVAGTLRSPSIAVVADILRATSVMSAALYSGVSEILPCLEVEEARLLAASMPDALLCGERQGIMPEGFDLGNSPGDYTPAICQGRRMVMTTTNGTRALMACSSSKRLYTLSFSNIRAIFQALAGTYQPISWEDSLACGMLAHALLGAGHEPGDDSTQIILSLYEAELGWMGIGQSGYQPRLVEILKRGRGGKRVCEIGLEKDIVEVARLNEFDILTQVFASPWRIIQANPVI